MTNFQNNNFESYKAYLFEIKSKLLRFALIFGTVFLAGFFLAAPILKKMLYFFRVDNASIVATSPFQFFSVAFDIALFLAIVVTFPVAIFLIFSFLKSALTKKERGIFKKALFFSIILFCLGFSFGAGMMYYAIKFLAGFNYYLGIANMWNISIFISQLLLASALLGLCFQFPIVLTLLVRLKIISVDVLRQKRRLAVMIVFIVAAILPPPEVMATVAIAIPLIFLYELTIFINRKYSLDLQGNL